ncbi:type II secretion system F family protein [Saliterribacillus persicus]|uniref:Competence protein ComGB n=1 Tax=Saliterribacillus persicus TaxID=930114 RepID=A0A368XH94_9BACI|nr:type II secretion system F family protein [Saliterribacillus persicus]RCW65384.1 competence protein ComGB [Saliterribacillus persicus]
MDLRIPLFSMKKKQKLTIDLQYQILNRLLHLLERDYPLLDALEIMKWEVSWKKILNLVESNLQNGKSFSTTLDNVGFETNVVSFMAICLKQGNIQQGLRHCTLMLKQQRDFLSQLNRVLRYPLLLFTIFIILLFFLKHSIYPSFHSLFSTVQESTSILIYTTILIDTLYYTLISFIILLICVLFIFKQKTFPLSVDLKLNLFKKVPILNYYTKNRVTFLLSMHMSTLLDSGISLKDSLMILSKETKNEFLSFYSEFFIKHLERGQIINSVLPQCDYLYEDLQSIFQKNANYDQLSKDLSVYANFLLDESEYKTKKIILIIQPTFFCILAIFIIAIYTSLMLPMFDLITTI